jgi:acyl-coenzyme A synthetase/AMP-(fatty) acid ligase
VDDYSGCIFHPLDSRVWMGILWIEASSVLPKNGTRCWTTATSRSTAGSAGGALNTCYNALDRHVENGRGDQAGADLRQPGDRHHQDLSPTRSCGTRWPSSPAPGGLGVGKGDRVIIYMPMMPEAAMAMLACARIGAVHSVVFGGFSANELATRINDAKPKVIVAAPAASSRTAR